MFAIAFAIIFHLLHLNWSQSGNNEFVVLRLLLVCTEPPNGMHSTTTTTNERTRTTRRLNNRTSWTSPGHSCAQPQRARVRISNKNGNWRKYCIVYLSFSLSLFHSPSFRMSLSSLRSVLLYIIASTKIADPKNGRERRENNNKQTDSHTRHNQK